MWDQNQASAARTHFAQALSGAAVGARLDSVRREIAAAGTDALYGEASLRDKPELEQAIDAIGNALSENEAAIHLLRSRLATLMRPLPEGPDNPTPVAGTTPATMALNRHAEALRQHTRAIHIILEAAAL